MAPEEAIRKKKAPGKGTPEKMAQENMAQKDQPTLT